MGFAIKTISRCGIKLHHFSTDTVFAGCAGSMGHNQSVPVSQGVDNRSLHCQIVALGATGVLLTTAATC